MGIEFLVETMNKSLKLVTNKYSRSVGEKNNIEEKITACEGFIYQTAAVLSLFHSQRETSRALQLLSSDLTFGIVNLFIEDIRNINKEIESIKSETELYMNDAILQKIGSVISLVKRSFSPGEETLKSISNVDNFLSETRVLIEEKLSRKHIIDFSYKLDKKSIDLFNLGFHLLNSKNILNIPDEEVTDGPFDFKSKYFPDFEPLRWNDYNTAAKLFEISAKVDPKNILARIFREVSLLKGDMTNGDACYDRDEIIQNLLYIITEYPNHALGHIELANAYSSMSCDDLAHKHIKIALKIGEKSTYINYRAYQIYYSLNCKTEANEILRWANTNHQEILRYSYYRALSARNQHKLSRARDIIMEAFNNGYYTYNIIQSGKNIQDELYYGDSVSEESIALNNEIIIAEKVVLERKMQKKKYLEKYDFRKFHSIQISDYSFTVTYKADNSDTIGSGLNGKKSIRFVDLYCSFIELEELNLLSIPLVFKLGELFRDSDVLYFKNLNLEEVFCNYGD